MGMRTLRGWFVASIQAPSEDHWVGWVPCMDWCVRTFGTEGQDWLYNSEGVFEFKNDADRTAFLLMWDR